MSELIERADKWLEGEADLSADTYELVCDLLTALEAAESRALAAESERDRAFAMADMLRFGLVPEAKGRTRERISTAIFNAMGGSGWTYEKKAERVREGMASIFGDEKEGNDAE